MASLAHTKSVEGYKHVVLKVRPVLPLGYIVVSIFVTKVHFVMYYVGRRRARIWAAPLGRGIPPLASKESLHLLKYTRSSLLMS